MARTSTDILSLAAREANPLSPNHLKQDLRDLAGSIATLQVFARVAVEQPVIDPKVLGDDANILLNLQQHQTTAHRNAQYLNGTLAPAAMGTLNDVLAYSKTMDAFLAQLEPLVPNAIDDPSARRQAEALLAQLDLEAGTRQAASNRVSNDLQVAAGKVQIDHQNLDADLQQVDQEISSDSGALAKLHQQISDLDKKINGEIAGVVVAALAVTAGGVVIGVGALAELPSGTSSTAIVVAGVGIVAASAIGLAGVSAALGVDNDRLAQLYRKAAALNTTLTLVKAVGQQVRNVADVTAGLFAASSTVQGEWATVREGLTSLRADLAQAADTGDTAHIATAIALARRDWADIAATAQDMLSRIVGLTPQDVAKIVPQEQMAAAA